VSGMNALAGRVSATASRRPSVITVAADHRSAMTPMLSGTADKRRDRSRERAHSRPMHGCVVKVRHSSDFADPGNMRSGPLAG
jgi:hypothetical protein